jgi:hypothetical protein
MEFVRAFIREGARSFVYFIFDGIKTANDVCTMTVYLIIVCIHTAGRNTSKRSDIFWLVAAVVYQQ